MALCGWALLGQIGREMGGNELVGTSLGHNFVNRTPLMHKFEYGHFGVISIG
jgi:hypothetical protein